jgi:hypothetical protein
MTATEAAARTNDRPPVRAKRRPRSAVTSGRRPFITGDPNSAWARRFHDLVQGHVSDMGGRSNISEAQFALCRRAATLECELERLEGFLSQDQEISLDEYGRAASHLRRILEVLGLKREPRDVTLGDDSGVVEVFTTPMRARWAEQDKQDAAAEQVAE